MKKMFPIVMVIAAVALLLGTCYKLAGMTQSEREEAVRNFKLSLEEALEKITEAMNEAKVQ